MVNFNTRASDLINTVPSPTEVRSNAQPSKEEEDVLRQTYNQAREKGNLNANETQAQMFAAASSTGTSGQQAGTFSTQEDVTTARNERNAIADELASQMLNNPTEGLIRNLRGQDNTGKNIFQKYMENINESGVKDPRNKARLMGEFQADIEKRVGEAKESLFNRQQTAKFLMQVAQKKVDETRESFESGIANENDLKKAQREEEKAREEAKLTKAQLDKYSREADSAQAALKWKEWEEGAVMINGEIVDKDSAEAVFSNVGSPKDKSYGECSYFGNRITDGGKWAGDTWESKISQADNVYRKSDAGSLSTESYNLEAGNRIFMPMGNENIGHEATVVEYDKQTGVINVVESNRFNDGQMTTGTYNVKDLEGFKEWGVAKTKFKPKYEKALSGSVEGEGEGLGLVDSVAIGKMAFGTRISDREGAKVEEIIADPKYNNRLEVVMDLLGYNLDKNEELGETLLNTVSQYVDPDKGLAGFDLITLASLLNKDNKAGAINKVEKFILNKAKNDIPENYTEESNVRNSVQRSNDLKGYIEQLGDMENPIGEFSGTFEEWVGRFKSKEAQTVATKAMQIVKDFANKFMGANMTDHEIKFYSPIIPKLGDDVENFLIKLDSLKTDPMTRLNNVRETFSLPRLDEDSLFDRELRAGLFEGGKGQQPAVDSTELDNIKSKYNVTY